MILVTEKDIPYIAEKSAKKICKYGCEECVDLCMSSEDIKNCPLRKYNVSAQKKPSIRESIISGITQPTLIDCIKVCADCHGKLDLAALADDRWVVERNPDCYKMCSKCPVNGLIEAISEAEAEARMS